MLEAVLKAYGITAAQIEPLGNGLINHTWKISIADEQYVLQRINENVFLQPQNISFNIKQIGDYLQAHHPTYLFTSPVASTNGEEMICVDEHHYRLFSFVPHSHTVDVVNTPEQAYEAARQFGKFTRLLSGFDASQLRPTLHHFHDLEFRYRQFLQALKNGNKERVYAAKELVEQALKEEGIVDHFRALKTTGKLKLRVTHHDAKISNVLFDQADQGLCVIDLDTVMPGYFISDLGDMMRTYLSPVSEEEKDYDKICIREEFYSAVVQGYCSEMQTELSEGERQNFFYAGRFMMYMQALRFLTDHLANDEYYGAKYEGHNLVRATNQFVLLARFDEKRELLQKIFCDNDQD